MSMNFGWVTFPGIDRIEDCSFTDQSGPGPAKATMTIHPQDGVPQLIGDLVWNYNDNQIVIRNMIIDSATFVRNSGGKIVQLTLLDERWAWKYGQITGRYNIRLPNNFVDPAHEKTPKQLATLCFAAMGVTNFNVSVLPDNARPEIDWQAANPAESLAQMCDDLGCRIVPKRSTGSWNICVTGEGANLRDDLPYQDAGTGIDPKERPDFIQVITDNLAIQCALKLEPCGRDLDQSWRHARMLSYTPSPFDVNDPRYKIAFGFGDKAPGFEKISPNRVLQPDGTAISPQELARQFIYRAWRISNQKDVTGGRIRDGQPLIKIDGLEQYPELDRYVTRKQIILTDKLAQCYTDERGEIHTRPAFVWGSFENLIGGEVPDNYPDGTRIDFQAAKSIDPEQRASFSLSVDPIDTDRSIITISTQMRKIDKTQANHSSYEFATLRYTCAINIRDKVTWQPIRYFRKRNLGRGGNPANVLTIDRRDIKPWIINLYNSVGVCTSTSNNLDDVNAQCDYYLDQEQRKLESIATESRTYIGLFLIDMDGAIQQVTYRTGKQGHDTIVSRGNEHDIDIPSYSERRQRDGRESKNKHLALLAEISKRRIETQGTFNTL